MIRARRRPAAPLMAASPSPSQPWEIHDSRFDGDLADPDRASSPWSGHRWFAYDLVRWLRPGRLVELGTHYGVSFYAMVQAVRDGGLATECHAVDTWQGDPHAGFYGEEVYDQFTRILGELYPGVDVVLHRMTFDEALGRIDDDSVDLLHIDGFHSYEAAQHDFETWLPKLAPNGVVLMHDVNASSGYGSADHWAEEIAPRYPSFAFDHNFGLGVVLPKGTAGREYLLGDEFARWRPYYEHRAGHELGLQHHRDQTRMIEARDAEIARQRDLLADREETIASQARLIDARDEAIAAQEALIDARDEAIAAQARMVDERNELLAARDTRLAAVESDVARLRPERDVYLAELLAVEKARAVDAATAPAPAIAAPPPPPPPPASSGAKAVLKAAVRRLPTPARDVVAAARRRWWRLQEIRAVRRAARPAREAIAGLVDAEFYRRKYGAADPVAHYVSTGAAAGRDPRPGFDTAFYTAFNGDLPAATNPFAHYVTAGAAEGRPPSPRALRAMLDLPPGDPPAPAAPLLLLAADGNRRATPLAEVPLADYDLVTFDLWDTLLTRRRPPEAAKLDTCRHLAGTRALQDAGAGKWEIYDKRLEVESRLATARATEHGWGEYDLAEVLAAVLAELTGAADDELAAAAAAYEVDREAEHTTVRADVGEWFAKVSAAHPQVAVVTDFYMPEDMVRPVAAAAGLDLDGVPVVTSVEQGVSKAAGGQLHERVRAQLGVAADRHLHVGDSEHGDGIMQTRGGGHAVIVPPPVSSAEFPLHGRLDPAALGSALRSRSANVAAGLAAAPPRRWADYPGALGVAALRAGTSYALLPTAVVAGAIERARTVGTDRVFYLTREGAVLRRVHEAVAPHLPGPAVAAEHLEVSRRATFGATVEALDSDRLKRLWDFYREQSPAELLHSLGLEPGTYRPLLAAAGIAPDDPLGAEALRDVLAEKTVATVVNAELALQRSRVTEYLRDRFGDREVLVVADIGWRGSIQDNLAALFPDRLFHGMYLGLLPYLSPQLANAGKQAVGPDGNLGHDLTAVDHFVGALERLFTGQESPITGYTRNSEGRVEPRHGPPADPAAGMLASRFQDGLVLGAEAIAEVLDAYALDADDLRPAVAATLDELLRAPHTGAAAAVYARDHDEDFGRVGRYPRTGIAAVVRRHLDAAAHGDPPPDLATEWWPPGLARHPAVVGVRSALAGPIVDSPS